MFRSGDPGHDGQATCRDDDPVCRIRLAVDFDGMGIDEVRLTREQRNATFVEIAGIDAVQTRDVRVTFGADIGPGMLSAAYVEAEVPCMLQKMGVMRGVPHDLLRHAADIDAGAAKRTRFDGCRLYTVFSRPLCMCQAAAAATDH